MAREIVSVPIKAPYDKHEAASILRVSVSWLEKRAAARLIPFTMLGGSYRFTDEHIAEIIRLNEQTPTSDSRKSSPEPARRRSRLRSRQAPTQQLSGPTMLRARPRAPKQAS